MTQLVALGLGSNRQARLHLARACELCCELPQSKLIARSRLYLSPPWGGAAPGRYSNAVLALETSRDPWHILSDIQQVEKKLGRLRGVRYGPRVIDIDLLWYQGAQLKLPWLQLPHPRLLQRRFALQPLVEVLPDAVLAPGLRARAALARCVDRARLQPISWGACPDPAAPARHPPAAQSAG